MENKKDPTPYEEVNEILRELLAGVQAILKKNFTGMYLYGSLTYGGFDRSSDVDYIVVTEEELSEKEFKDLQELHREIARMDVWCATQLEGSYIPRQALLEFVPERALFYHIDRGEGEMVLERMQLDDQALQQGWWGGWVILQANLYEEGIALAGPPASTLVKPVSPVELRQATLANIPGWMEPFLQHPERIDSHGYQAYIVLTLCRMMYVLKTGRRCPKREAALWAEKSLDGKWAGLVRRAWHGRENPQSPIPPGDLQATLDFIQYMIDHTEAKEEVNENTDEEV